jgi:5-hydroxyisourate hydrolase
MKRISTHILDIGLGKPARDVPVRLERHEAHGGWRRLNDARTDADGRCAQLLPAQELGSEHLSSGNYRLVFDTASYFKANNVEGLYPVVEITFHVREGESHFHVPLLLSAHGYTTYRGS